MRETTEVDMIVTVAVDRINAGEHGSREVIEDTTSISIVSSATNLLNQISFSHDITPPGYLSPYVDRTIFLTAGLSSPLMNVAAYFLVIIPGGRPESRITNHPVP
jgi:hypothetical protein